MKTRILVAAVFLVGCAVGGVSGELMEPMVPTANAQHAERTSRWEHKCVEAQTYEDLTDTSNRLGS